MQAIRAGDTIVFGRGKLNKSLVDITIGKLYDVFDVPDFLTPVIQDDAGDFFEWDCETCKPTKIIRN